MACSACAQQRAKAAAQLKQGNVAGAAKTAVEGVAAMVGLKAKEDLSAAREAKLETEGPLARKARLAREAHEKWLAAQKK